MLLGLCVHHGMSALLGTYIRAAVVAAWATAETLWERGLQNGMNGNGDSPVFENLIISTVSVP